jgi:hypothetical protein
MEKTYHPKRDLNNLPVEFKLQVVAFNADDASHPTVTMGDGSVRPAGLSIAELRKRFGGDEGEVRDLSGKTHFVSLKPWADSDPDKTFIIISFQYKGDLKPEDDPVIRALEEEEAEHRRP